MKELIIRLRLVTDEYRYFVISEIESFGYEFFGTEKWFTIIMKSGVKYKIVAEVEDPEYLIYNMFLKNDVV